MKLICCTAVTLVALCIAPGFIRAQTEMVEPKYKFPPAPVANPQTVHSLFTGATNVIAWWLNLWGQSSVNAEIEAAVNLQIAKQEEVLQWTGNGALLNLRVVRAKSGESPLRPVGILGEGASVVGYGPTPEDALIDHWRLPQLELGVPDGWVVDEVMSCYVWVQRNEEGKLVTRAVPKGTMLELHKQARDNWPILLQRRLEARRDNLETWRRIALTAQSRIQDQLARQAVADSLTAVIESRKRVAESNARLQAALERERSAGKTLSLLRTLQGILTVVQLVNLAADALEENPARFENVKSGAGVVKITEDVLGERKISTVQMRAVVLGDLGDLRQWLDTLWTRVAPAQPPAPVRSELTFEDEKE